MIRFFSIFHLCLLIMPTSALEWFTTTRAGIPDEELEAGPARSGWSLSREKSEGKAIVSIFFNSELNRKIVTTYSGEHLISKEEFNAEGELLNHVEYAYDSDGKVRVTLFSDKIDGSEPSKIFASLDNNVDWSSSRVIEGYGKNWKITNRNRNGRNVREITLKDAMVSEEVVYTLDEKDNVLEKRVFSGDVEILSEFDSAGFLQKETINISRLVISEKTYEWKNSKLISIEEKTGNDLIRLEKKWDREQISEETEWLNGEKKRVTTWSSPKAWIDTLYRKGKPVVRIYWEDKIRVKEEIVNLGLGIKAREQ